MRLFVKSLRGDAKEWFSDMFPHSINSWNEFRSAFMEQFGERICASSMFNDFMEIHIRNGELVPEFKLRFMKALKKIPKSCRP